METPPAWRVGRVLHSCRGGVVCVIGAEAGLRHGDGHVTWALWGLWNGDLGGTRLELRSQGLADCEARGAQQALGLGGLRRVMLAILGEVRVDRGDGAGVDRLLDMVAAAGDGERELGATAHCDLWGGAMGGVEDGGGYGELIERRGPALGL
jgi:hypothetical protein